jgi:polysaccharide biosynthesis transport protein
MPNISVVQSPSIAMKTTRDVKKIVLGLAGGGIALGLGFAFLLELLLDRSVKRPLELETLLGIPLLLSIPYLNGRSHLRLRWPSAGEKSMVALKRNGHFHAAPWESEHFIRPFSEALRDRLVLYFELNRLNHKPKLVAVTDCSGGAGASTLAGGLAAALSETGDGKVLLVDMNVGRPEIHPFFRGTPACSLTEALAGAPAPAGENLYLAVASSPDTPEAPVIPKKFYDLMPHLKASDFDYIIFDMPALGQTSITLPMARFMDKVIVVVEGEKSNRDFVRRAYAELLACRASVSVIFNKARSYTPKWLGTEG